MTSIYQIDAQIQSILDGLPETGEFGADALESFEELQLERKEKIRSTALYYKSLEARDLALDNEIKRLQRLKEITNNKMSAVKNYLDFGMNSEGAKEIDFQTIKVKYKLNPPRVKIVDQNKIPKEFIVEKVTTRIDKSAIKKAGKDVPGAKIVQDERLEIL